MNATATPLKEVDLNDPEAVIDGRGNAGDDDAANEDKKPTREEKMKGEGLSELQKAAFEAIQEITNLEKSRSEVNAKIQAIRERLEAKGISKKSLAVALMVSKMNEDHLDGFDTAYLICRKAINLPVQSEMFDYPPQR